MAVSKPELTVEVEGEEHKLDVVPKETSKVVLLEKEKLLGAVDLQMLVTDLGRVGKFIRIAYNGVGAAGPKFVEIQIEVQSLGYDITKLCDKSALTVAKFKKASATVLTSLKATYGYLIGHMEKIALVTLTNVSRLAGEMAKAALQLHKEFEDEKEKVKTTLEKTQRAKGDEAQRIKDKAKEREQLEAKHEEQRKLMEDSQRLEREAEAQRREMEHNENEAINSIGYTNPVKVVLNAFTSHLGFKLFDEKEAEKKAVHWKEKKIEALRKENELRQKRYEAFSIMTEFASKMTECKTEQNMAEAAEGALHQAIGALKELADVMMQAAQFWEQMEDHCKSLAEEGVKSQIEAAIEYPEEMRMVIWTSDPFKEQAIQFYAGWVALNSVCSEYMEQIKLTQKDLHAYLKENPSYEESRQNIEALAKEFLTDLKKDQDAIANKEFQAQEEIKALEGADQSRVS